MKKKPISAHIVQGTYRSDRHAQRSLQFAPGALCPKFLTKTARAEWNRVAPMLEQAGLLQESDTMTLAAYCTNYAGWREAMDTVKKQGMVITVNSLTRTGSTSKPIRNPAVALMHSFEKAMLASAAKFGLDPHSRSRIEMPAEQNDADDHRRSRRSADDPFDFDLSDLSSDPELAYLEQV
jgi:P27 family predicted phage terminase small subunit